MILVLSGVINVGQSLDNSLVKDLSRFKILITNNLFFDVLPKSFNKIEVRGVRRQKDQLNAQSDSPSLNKSTVLVSSIIQNDINGDAFFAARTQHLRSSTTVLALI